MLARLLIGIVKGLIVGALLGIGLAKLGLAAPGVVVSYLAAALAGVLIGLVAGKPIWAKDAKIEAGMKAFVGALLGAGLMFAARRWLTMPVPFSLGPMSAPPNTSLGETAITSLAGIAAVLGGFYEADNDPSEAQETPASAAKKAPASNRRIAAGDTSDELDDELEGEADKKRSKK
jgi:hypothetical protein